MKAALAVARYFNCVSWRHYERQSPWVTDSLLDVVLLDPAGDEPRVFGSAIEPREMVPHVDREWQGSSFSSVSATFVARAAVVNQKWCLFKEEEDAAAAGEEEDEEEAAGASASGENARGAKRARK